MLDRRAVLARSAAAAIAVPAITILSSLVMEGKALATQRPQGADGFDFLVGRWKVRHRKLRERLVNSSDWYEFPGTMDVKPILAGLGNIDENELLDPSGAYFATSLRVFRPDSGKWSIYWIDGRASGIEQPLVGTFHGKIGRFFADDVWKGRQVRVRFTYEDVAPGRAQWTQAYSVDGEQSWETNWIMDFSRDGRAPA